LLRPSTIWILDMKHRLARGDKGRKGGTLGVLDTLLIDGEVYKGQYSWNDVTSILKSEAEVQR